MWRLSIQTNNKILSVYSPESFGLFLYYVKLSPNGVPLSASFCLTAGGLMRLSEEGDIRREKTILMKSLKLVVA